MIDEIDEKIIKFLQEGLNQTEIAKKLDRTQGAINYRIKKMSEKGIEIPQNKIIDEQILEYLKEGLTRKEIAKKFGKTDGAINKRIIKMKKSGMEIPIVKKEIVFDEKNKKILEYLEEKLTQKEIAKILGVNEKTIRYRIIKMREQGIEIPQNKVADEQILEYLKEGLSQREIANKTDLAIVTIKFRVKRMREQGIEIPKKNKITNDEILEYLKEGFTQKEIAEIVGITELGIHQRIKRMRENGIEIIKGKKENCLAEKDIKTLEYLEKGLSQAEIARIFGVTDGAITHRIKRMQEKGIEISQNKKELDEIDNKIIEGLSEGLSKSEIAKKINMSKAGINYRTKKMQKNDKKKSEELVKGIMNLIKTRNATMEQIKIIANYYGVDLEETFNLLDER